MNYKIDFIRKNTTDKWRHFKWLVTINGYTFTYKTGLSHATPRWNVSTQHANRKPKDSILVSAEWVHIPKKDDVLYALFSDASMGQESFNDFCDTLDYNKDSIEILDIYRECMKTKEKLSKALGNKFLIEKERIEALEP